MAGSVNVVFLMGYVGKEPKKHTWPDGSTQYVLSLATSRRWKDRQTGEPREHTNWHRVVVTNQGLCTIVEKFVKKGSRIHVMGSLENKKWKDKDQQDRHTTEVELSPGFGSLTLVDAKKDGAVPYTDEETA